MAYTTAEGRRFLLDSLNDAAGELALALAQLGEAYERLDVATQDRLEEELFGPVQRAYGRAQRTGTAFAGRAGLDAAAANGEPPQPLARDANTHIADAVAALGAADGRLAALQDSAEIVEVGDAELRAGVAGTRTAIAGLPQRARELVRGLGR